MTTPDATIVNENARLEVLRRYAFVRDHVGALNATLLDGEVRYDDDCPLFADPWQNAVDAVRLAADEAVKLGQLRCIGKRKLIARHPQTGQEIWVEGSGNIYSITDAGYAYIRARDLLGETAQEAS